MVKERSDIQFVGLVTRLDDLFAYLLNPEMLFLKPHLYQLSDAIFHYIVSEYFRFPYLGLGAVEFAY